MFYAELFFVENFYTCLAQQVVFLLLMYAIIDIETTGGSPVSEKITEIAVLVHDGEQITDEFVTLINPERKIPYHITSLTGISNEMVADAPKFYEVARRLVEITTNCTFVAHNVNFDYEFIRNEFKRLGYDFRREKLCTVQLSRKYIPGLPSYSLGKLCRHLGIDNKARHRAAGDAQATVRLFEHILAVSRTGQDPTRLLYGINKADLHPGLSPDLLVSLPEETGVYYFFNEKAELTYIGKSKNIRQRVLSHFRNFTSRKSIEMRNSIVDIDYELTGNELIALLKESHEIKRDKPVYNRSQRRTTAHYGLYHYTDSGGYINLVVAKNAGRIDLPVCSFSTQRAGKAYLQRVVDEHELCQKLCGLYPTAGACFHYEIGECKGACIGHEPAESYNERVNRILNKHSFDHHSFFILDHGRKPGEIGVIKIDCGKYIGYGFIEEDYYGGQISNLHACISDYHDNRDVQQIIRLYLTRNHSHRVIPFNGCL